jgi:hypothetical protein
MDGHILLRDFVYYAYTILPFYFDQRLRMQLNIKLTVEISFESPEFRDFESQPLLSSVRQSSRADK